MTKRAWCIAIPLPFCFCVLKLCSLLIFAHSHNKLVDYLDNGYLNLRIHMTDDDEDKSYKHLEARVSLYLRL